MHTSISLGSFGLGLALTLSLAGCGGAGTTGSDSGTAAADTGSGAEDTGSPGVDAGNDASATADAGSDAASSTTDAGSTCPPPGTGTTCTDTASCGAGLECSLGRCIPQGRETCGGFAAHPCTMPPYTQCTYQPGHGDVGTCLTPDELTCVCATDPTSWTCG